MDKQTTRAFAFGLFVSAIILFGYQQFFSSPTSEPILESTSDPSNDNLEANELQEEVRYWQEEYEKLVMMNQIEPLTEENKELEKHNEFILTIHEGMNSSEISSHLEEAGMIDDAISFNDYLEGKNLQRYIQIGTYVISTGMNYSDIADLITNSH